MRRCPDRPLAPRENLKERGALETISWLLLVVPSFFAVVVVVAVAVVVVVVVVVAVDAGLAAAVAAADAVAVVVCAWAGGWVGGSADLRSVGVGWPMLAHFHL